MTPVVCRKSSLRREIAMNLWSTSRNKYALAGSSGVRHCALYWMGTPSDKGASLRSVVEVIPSTSLGSLQEFLWVGRADVLILVSGNGYVRMMLYDQSTDSVDEEQFRPCDTGVVSACSHSSSSSSPLW